MNVIQLGVDMGGYGSTRWRHHTAKEVVEDCLVVDAAQVLPSSQEIAARATIPKRTLFSAGQMVGYSIEYADLPILRLVDWRLEVTRVRLTPTKPFPDSVPRWWLTCPNCNRRCRCLYRPPSSRRFACRKCHDLSYRARRMTNASRHLEGLIPGLRPLEKAEKLETRMGKYKLLVQRQNAAVGTLQTHRRFAFRPLPTVALAWGTFCHFRNFRSRLRAREQCQT